MAKMQVFLKVFLYKK